MAFEIAIADEFLYSTLSGDATLTGLVGANIFADIAPEKTEGPFVVYQAQSDSEDVMGVGQDRIMSQVLYTVKAVVDGASYVPLHPIVARLDTLLHKASGVVSSGVVLASTRERTFKLNEVIEGVEWRTLGLVFRVLAQ